MEASLPQPEYTEWMMGRPGNSHAGRVVGIALVDDHEPTKQTVARFTSN